MTCCYCKPEVPEPKTEVQKPVLAIKNVEIRGYAKGMYVLFGTLLQDHHTNKTLKAGSLIRSSLLLKADFATGLFETQNALYQQVFPVKVYNNNDLDDLMPWE